MPLITNVDDWQKREWELLSLPLRERKQILGFGAAKPLEFAREGLFCSDWPRSRRQHAGVAMRLRELDNRHEFRGEAVDMRIRDLISNLIIENREVLENPSVLWEDKDDFPIPGFVTVEGVPVYFSKSMENITSQIVSKLHASDDNLRQRVGIAELRKAAREALASALVEIDPGEEVSNSARTVAMLLRTHLDEKFVTGEAAYEHCFGCSLFSRIQVPPFSIGPVIFKTKTEWLSRKISEGFFSETTGRRLLKLWAGGKLRKRKLSEDSRHELDAIAMVGDCKYVCSVSTQGHALGFSREKALIAARIATTSIALLWPHPSNRLEGLNLIYDRRIHHQISICFHKGNIFSSRSKINIGVDGDMTENKWLDIINERKGYFNFVGYLISQYAEPRAISERGDVILRLFHALLWFHEACRDRSPLISTVKFAAVIDTLADGKGKEEILRLIEKKFGWAKDIQIFNDGMTVGEAVSKIYEIGRSRTMHGNNKQFHIDWSDTSGRAERLARYCLLSSIEERSKEVISGAIKNTPATA